MNVSDDVPVDVGEGAQDGSTGVGLMRCWPWYGEGYVRGECKLHLHFGVIGVKPPHSSRGDYCAVLERAFAGSEREDLRVVQLATYTV